MSDKPDRVPGWVPENELAESLGFTCVHDASRGNGWSRFRIGQWHVWSAVVIRVDYRTMAWQAARVVDDKYSEHLTKSGVDPVKDLEIALRYARARHEGNTDPAAKIIDELK